MKRKGVTDGNQGRKDMKGFKKSAKKDGKI
jgi:hypothetical protein